MASTEAEVTGRPCEQCGGIVVVGDEFAPPGDAHDEAIRSEWCTNLHCPSNWVIPGLHRVGINYYDCQVCGERLRTPMSDVFQHRREH